MIDQIAPLATSRPGTVSPAYDTARASRTGAGTSATETDFGTVLGNLITDSADVLRAAESTSVKGVMGQASVQEVVEAVLAAEQTLQAAIAIRDKVTAAYLELSRMAI